KDIGTYSAGEGGSLMGHESETIRTPQKPSVPRDNATMGQEPTDLNPQDKPLPVIPSDDATMGHEKEVGLSGGDNRFTGGDQGQGKTELASGGDTVLTAEEAELYHMRGFGTSKQGLSSLADRIAKKLAPKEPVAKDPDIQPISDGGTIGKEEKFTADDPTNVEGSATESLMGHESETIPSAAKPSVPRDNATIGKEDADLNPQDKPQPTIPSSDATIGHEKEVGLSGGDATYTGGDQGAGKATTSEVDDDLMHMKGFGSSKEGVNRLADRILEIGQNKKADKLKPKAPVADDEDIKPIKDNGTIGKEEKFDAKEPTTTEGGATESLIGHEKETLK
ncbi:hypothetical protein LCGC14_3150050, partial [marine sediment metagenome]